MANKVTHAPKAVIDELDRGDFNTPLDLLYTLSENGIKETTKWFIQEEVDAIEAQKALVNHVFGNERLQPEREPRYVVEVGEGAHRQLLTKFKGMYRSTIIDITEDHVNYGKDTHTLSLEEAKHIQAVVGGTIEEIK
ncbi:hypothetical protein WS105_0635 [Weissella ceti]|uniref:hypothetical protein n=1 Tax=Weissella ceti TaxID=759620 RepID=UPI0004F6BBAB|nr:hypothetical protein [Weissella ceti]AIM64225.1 hypothetical protein WS105_0635 [Weissella ceti]